MTKPVLESKPWGGATTLSKMYDCKPQQQVGEVWLLSGMPGKETPMSHLENQRSAFPSQLVDDLIGDVFPCFPLLIKVIEAKQWLSVQVHPDDAYARDQESQAWGKNEFWLVLHTEKPGKIITGLRGIDQLDRLNQLWANGRLDDHLEYTSVSKGDGVYLPAGTVHALGPGVLTLEIQQASDLTYRLFDWGRDRDMHIQQGTEVWMQEDNPVLPLRGVDHFCCPYFSIHHRRESEAQGFCAVFAIRSVHIDQHAIPAFRLVIIPSGKRAYVRGEHVQITLGPYWSDKEVSKS